MNDELNREIAEKVIGERLPQAWPDPSVGPSRGDPGGYRVGVKPYSTDIATAMEVLAKADGAWELERYREPDDMQLYFKCSLRFGDNIGYAWGCATPELAICRAALKAINAKTENPSQT